MVEAESKEELSGPQHPDFDFARNHRLLSHVSRLR
jgi:hypothetical protein